MVKTYSKASKLTMRMRKLATTSKPRGSYQPKVLFDDLTCSDDEITANENEHQSEDEAFQQLWDSIDQDKENVKRRWRNSCSALKSVSPTVGSARSREVGNMPVPSRKRSSSPSPDPPCKKALNYDHRILNMGSPKNLFVGQKSPQQPLQEQESPNGLQRSLCSESLRSLSLNGSEKSPSFNGSQKSPPFSGGLVTPSVSITPKLSVASGSPQTNGTPQANGTPKANGTPETNGSPVSPASTPSPVSRPLATKFSVSPSTPPSSNELMTRRQRPFFSLRGQREQNSESHQTTNQRIRKALNIKPSLVKSKGRPLEDIISKSKLIHDVMLPSKPTLNLEQKKTVVSVGGYKSGSDVETDMKLCEKLQSPDSTTNAILLEDGEIVDGPDGEIVTGPLATREETITLSHEQEPEERREPHLIGFPNPGNLCWMNSVVQCVVSLAPLMDDIQEHMANGIEPVKYSNVLRCLLKILNLRQQGQVARVNDTLRKFHKSLEAVKQEFATDTQQDCPEFLTELLDHLRDEFFRLSRNSTKGATLREISHNAPDDTVAQRENVPNPIRDNTEITMKQQKKCVNCLEVVVGEIREPILIVDVPSIPKCSLQHALKGYFKSADIERQCDGCSARTSTTTTSITRLPRVLTVQLKRYICKERTPESTFPGIEKVNSRVQIPEWLSVQEVITDDVQLPSVRITNSVAPINVFLDESSNQEDRELEEAKLLSLADDEAEEEQIRQALAASMLDAPRSLPGSVANTPVKDNMTTPVKEDECNLSPDYRLVAFIQHMGSNPNSGHYTSTVYNFGLNCWMNYNDADVQRQTFEVATGDRAQRNGYIFFYIHRLQFEALAAAAESSTSG